VRLDNVLCNEAWINTLPESSYECQNQASSDHSPLWLQFYPGSKGGPKPFKFFNYWMNCPGFKDMLHNTWHRSVFSD